MVLSGNAPLGDHSGSRGRHLSLDEARPMKDAQLERKTPEEGGEPRRRFGALPWRVEDEPEIMLLPSRRPALGDPQGLASERAANKTPPRP